MVVFCRRGALDSSEQEQLDKLVLVTPVTVHMEIAPFCLAMYSNLSEENILRLMEREISKTREIMGR
jgi:hypothetical protein